MAKCKSSEGMRSVAVEIYDDSSTRINPATEEILSNVISTGNSSTTNLGIGGVFTGDWEDMSQYAAIAIAVKANQDSATNGFAAQWSTNGTTSLHEQSHTITANLEFTTQGMLEAKYFRIVYTNGGVAQTSFELQTIYMKTPSVGEIQQLKDIVDDTGDAQLVRAVLTGKKPDGDYANVQTTAGGNLKVSLEEYEAATNPVRSDLEGVGDLTVGTTEVEIVITGTPTFGVRIRADVANTGIIFIGKTGVLSDGSNDFVRLEAGDEVVAPYNDASNALYAISDTASQTINIGALL